MLGWMRHMKVVSEYNLRWDGYELGAFMRFGLINRDTAAAAISYNVALG